MRSQLRTSVRRKTVFSSLLVFLLFMPSGNASASTTWYVNGVSGSDTNNCNSPTTACRTIGHAISLAASGDNILVAPGTYNEHLTIPVSLTIIGANAKTTIIDAKSSTRVVTISTVGLHVKLVSLTIRGGTSGKGGGVYNSGVLTIINCTISGNSSGGSTIFPFPGGLGGGIYNAGTLTLTQSTISLNTASRFRPMTVGGQGGGIYNTGNLTINDSTIAGNVASGMWTGFTSFGGGLANEGGTVKISNTTFSGNSANYFSPFGVGGIGGGIFNSKGTVTLQNTIVAYSSEGGNCYPLLISNGYNLSSDGTCNFSNSGDRNNIDPRLGTLQYNGGPTQTMALPSGSPAVDAGNPSGCTDTNGNLLKTDQRGYPRHDPEDTGGCDIGAYERQSD